MINGLQSSHTQSLCDSFCFLLSYTPLTPSSVRSSLTLPVPPTQHFGGASYTLSSFCCGRRTRKFLVLLHSLSAQPFPSPQPHEFITRAISTKNPSDCMSQKPTIKSQSVYSVVHWDWNRRRRRRRPAMEKRERRRRTRETFWGTIKHFW